MTDQASVVEHAPNLPPPRVTAGVSIVIPVFNELSNIAKVLERVNALDLDKEIVIVDDGSTDGTADVLAAVDRTDVVKIHMSPSNAGKGFAIRVGLGYVTRDIVIIQDADLEYDPSDIPAVIAPIAAGEADVVYGSRFLGTITQMRLANRIANRVLTGLTQLLYRAQVSDMETGYKAFRRDVITKMKIRSDGFEIEPEITAKVLRSRVRLLEVPITYTARTVAEGKKIGWRDGVNSIWALVRYRLFD